MAFSGAWFGRHPFATTAVALVDCSVSVTSSLDARAPDWSVQLKVELRARSNKSGEAATFPTYC